MISINPYFKFLKQYALVKLEVWIWAHIFSFCLHLSRHPLSFAKRWKAPMGSDPVLRIKTSGVAGDMSL